MNRKTISLLALAALASGLVLALTGCFLFDVGFEGEVDDGQFKLIDADAAAAPMYITYVNRSDSASQPVIFVFAKNAIPGFDELADAVAWRVLPDIGKGSSSEFMVLPMCTVQATWGGVNRTQALVAEAGQRYSVIQDDTGIVLTPVGSSTQSNAIEVTCEVQIPGGVSVQLLNDGKAFMQESIVAFGQKASFIVERKLYWGVASEIQEGQMLATAVLNSDVFFEQSLEGATGATVTLTGNEWSGFQFEVTND